MKLSEYTAAIPLIPYLRLCGSSRRSPWNIHNRRLLDYLLVYVQEGVLEVIVDGETYVLEEREFAFIQPNTISSLRGLTETIIPYAHFDLFYHPRREESFATFPGQLDISEHEELLQVALNDFKDIDVPIQLKPSHPYRYRELLFAAIDCFQIGDLTSTFKAQCFTYQMVLAILEDYGPNRTKHTVEPSSLHWLKTHFAYHLSGQTSVEEMAQRSNLSVSRFHVLFREQFGTSPHQYLLRLRIDTAKELLRTTELTLQNISDYCGFSDIHHFARTFKSHTELPPGEFRRISNLNVL